MNGTYAKLGFAFETSFGTGVAPTTFLPGTEDIRVNIPRLREESPYGGRNLLPADPGRKEVRGGTKGHTAYPNAIGVLLKAALGDPSTSGTGPYTHTFTPPSGPVSDTQALPSVSLTRGAGSRTRRYVGGQLNQLTVNAPVDGRVAFDGDWIFKDFVDGVADPVAVLESASPFRFAHADHKRGGVAYPYIETLTLTISNNLETGAYQDGGDTISEVLLGRVQLQVQLTLAFSSLETWNDFVANGVNAWEFGWKNGNYELRFTVPRLNIQEASDPVSGAGRLTASATGIAELDSASGYAFQVTLINDTASY